MEWQTFFVTTKQHKDRAILVNRRYDDIEIVEIERDYIEKPLVLT